MAVGLAFCFTSNFEIYFLPWAVSSLVQCYVDNRHLSSGAFDHRLLQMPSCTLILIIRDQVFRNHSRPLASGGEKLYHHGEQVCCHFQCWVMASLRPHRAVVVDAIQTHLKNFHCDLRQNLSCHPYAKFELVYLGCVEKNLGIVEAIAIAEDLCFLLDFPHHQELK